MADRLLARFIGASTVNTAVGAGRYAPEQIHRRLAALARGMVTSHGTETDLVLEQLAGRMNPRRAKALYLALCLWWAAVACSAVAPGWSVFDGDVTTALLVVVLLTLAGIHVVGRVSRAILLRRFSLPPFGSPMWRVGLSVSLRADRFYSVLFLVVLFLVLFWRLAAPQGWGGMGLPHLALAAAGILGLLGCTIALHDSDLTAFGLTGWTRMGWATALAMVATGLILPGSAWFDPALRPGVLLLVPATFWLAHKALAGPWHLYYCALLVHRPRLPLRLARFLDWSVSAGLMRTSGVAYQFRHREFQEWLVRHPEP